MKKMKYKERNKMSFGVYKSYKEGDCNNSPYIAIFEDEKDAKQAVVVLEELRLNNRKDVIFACNEGWEFSCYWTYEEVPSSKTFKQFMSYVNTTLKECG